ncbi:DUF4270 domain-containing protein [Seonamhaeicola maritimus]|uniref:DUF4270 domain-containing protein n=1 Tax=Seonamhaeicola maritimus TaxID=2591822 RepID=A0A5C7GH64_9FLAO|nr:DUF4270 domain-containing protein [Seonamhaeicola maritimus]TXG36944.1 DUF4270 domain-containing protein [Seonamhaeicola maritimus]
MKKIIKALKIPAIAILLVTSIIACDKEFYVIESDVLGKDNANFNTKFEFLPIISYNKKLDSIQINNLPSNLLGYFDDPEYGPTTASVITQIVPTSFNPDFGKNPVIDSVILNIPYYSKAVSIDEATGNTQYSISDSLYGNKDANIRLSVYENGYFLRDINPDNLGEPQNYFSHASHGTTDNFARTDNSLINFDDFAGNQIKDTVFSPSSNAIETWVISETDTTKTLSVPAFRAKLDKPFWKTTILDKEGGAELSNSNNFKNYFRGLYFKAEAINNDGNMVLLNFGSADAKITIHYTKEDEDDATIKTQATYTFNFLGNRLNTFINNYNIALTNGNKTDGDDKLYLKGGEGSMAVVELFPTPEALNDFIDDFRISIGDNEYLKEETTGDFILSKLINEAHLVIYEDEGINAGGDSDFHKYDRIYAYDVKNNTPTIDYIIDPTDNAANPLNSKVLHLTQRDTIEKSYKVRLTGLLNNILQRDSTNTKIGLVLSTNVNATTNVEILNSEDYVTGVPAATVISPRGTVLHGTNSSNSDKRMKLKLFFTEPK